MQLPTGSALRPFRVDIPQSTIDRILNRVRDTQWPDRLDASDWRYGANWDYMKALARYWGEQFDWRKAEENLNRYPQFLARVGDYDIHFYHVKGRAQTDAADPHAWLARFGFGIHRSHWAIERSRRFWRIA